MSPQHTGEEQTHSLPDMPDKPETAREHAERLLNEAKAAGNPEPTAGQLVKATADDLGGPLAEHTAYDVKRQWRGHPAYQQRRRPPPPKRRRTYNRPRQSFEVSWEQVQAFLDEHKGIQFTRSQLSKATGIPETTITNLWMQKTGHGYAPQPDGDGPTIVSTVAALDITVGTKFTCVGYRGQGDERQPVISQDEGDGTLYRFEPI